MKKAPATSSATSVDGRTRRGAGAAAATESAMTGGPTPERLLLHPGLDDHLVVPETVFDCQGFSVGRKGRFGGEEGLAVLLHHTGVVVVVHTLHRHRLPGWLAAVHRRHLGAVRRQFDGQRQRRLSVSDRHM